MMKFIEQYLQLKNIFTTDREVISIPDSKTVIRNMEFHSRTDLSSTSAGFMEDCHIGENIRFRYPVFLPDNRQKHDQVIIFLHGLNERTWYKHLAGAKFLAENTGKAVIMFPLSYHINRGLPEWTDARKLAGLLERRKRKYPGIKEASVANLVLSERLTDYPERFFISGFQSAMDLIRLLREIKAGAHPLFSAGTHADFFAYSISCMLLQSLMISNPDNLLDKSKIVFFAGGSVFSHMQGTSKYIMDSVAFETIRKFYAGIAKRTVSMAKEFRPWFTEHQYGMAFKAIMSPESLRKVRVKNMAFFQDRLMVIALRNDKVIPVEGIREATGDKFFRSGKFSIVHFPYDYTHENPFPVLYRKLDEQVEKAFHKVFHPTLAFFAG